MIQTFKIIKGFDRIPADKMFSFSKSETGGHNFKLKKQSCRLDVRKYFFTNCVVNDWNSLPIKVVNADTINHFKDKLDSHWRHRMYDLPENYNLKLPFKVYKIMHGIDKVDKDKFFTVNRYSAT